MQVSILVELVFLVEDHDVCIETYVVKFQAV